jgi:negative regulator of sigma E activity
MKNHVLFANLVLLSASLPLAAADNPEPPHVSEVVNRLVERDAQRQFSLHGYSGMRRYSLQNDHMHKQAEMVVRVTGDADGTKHFDIVSEDGWKAAHKHVLHKMLESEAETSRPEVRTKTLISPDNYDFQMLSSETIDGRLAYEISVTPKRHDKYLFQGRIWVDTEDFAVIRADGSPAKNPSFWTKHVQFVHIYQKDGPFWFPLSTESVTDARIFGTTDLTIQYFDYKPSASPVPDKFIVTASQFGQP